MHALATTMITVPDKEIFLGLLEQHAGIIRKVALGYTSTFADRQDLTQEITLQLWRAYPRYSPDRPFSTWMYRIALLQQVIASLEPLDRGLMLLYLDDHSYREIAAVLGLTETNVATKLNRLKQRVREEMLKLNQQNS